jgi:hypothetical protein
VAPPLAPPSVLRFRGGAVAATISSVGRMVTRCGRFKGYEMGASGPFQ